MSEDGEDEFDYRTLLIVLVLYFPAAFFDSIDYYVNGTSLGYRLFSNVLFNPVWGFWGGLVGTIVEVYLVYYFRKKIFSWLKSWSKGKSHTELSKREGFYIFISYAIQDSERLKIASISKKLSTLPLIENVFCWELWDGYPNGNIIEFMEKGIEDSDIFIPVCTKSYMVSENCQKERKYALLHNKKMIPLYEDIKFVDGMVAQYKAIEIDQKNVTGITNLVYQQICAREK